MTDPWEDFAEPEINRLLSKLNWQEPIAYQNRLEIAGALLNAAKWATGASCDELEAAGLLESGGGK